MKIVVDDKIPYIRDAVEGLADEVVYAAAGEMTPQMVRDADALIVRTRTRCDRRLLEGSRVRFVATATIGYDHLDTDYLRKAGIAWCNAPGCNSASVAQYVQSALLLLRRERGMQLEGRTLGIVGVGNVGGKVAVVAREMGMRVLLCDPPRAEREGAEGFCSLQRVAEESDLVTFHVPLRREGEGATFHLADEAFFHALKRKPVLINTSRGEVVETDALIAALDGGAVSEAVIDVWEHEPDISHTLLYKTFLGTPHIAGYSADGKANAARMSIVALCRFFGLPDLFSRLIQPPAPANPVITARSLADAYLQMYDPRRDSEALKACPDRFEQLRGNYPLRREREAYTLVISG